MNEEHLLSLLGSLAPTFSPLNFKFAWKSAILLELVTAKHYTDLTLLHIDNWDLFLQCNAAFLCLHLVVRWIAWVIIHLKFILNQILVLIFLLYFI